MVGSETPKIRAACALGIPRSTAASTLILRSFEYGFMPEVSHSDQSSRKPLLEAAEIGEVFITAIGSRDVFSVPHFERNAGQCDHSWRTT
jgi:hypothetical protein